MRFSAYKVNIKHRASKPTGKISIWRVPEWTELHLFAIASEKQWYKDGILWAVMKEQAKSKIAKLGEDLEGNNCRYLYIAKYRCDPNFEWHGYPVHPKDDDMPPESILQLWLEENLIDKADKSKIKKGKFSI